MKTDFADWKRRFKVKFYDDDGKEIDPELVPKPSLCVTCANEERFCVLNWFDQKEEDDFVCGAYVSISARGRDTEGKNEPLEF